MHPILQLLILAIPIACVVRTVVNEEVFREVRQYCVDRSKNCRRLVERKLFYLFTCEYCFSHWVTLAFLVLTDFRLLYPDWRGLVIAFFSLVFVANSYLGLYSRLRVDITSERVEVEVKRQQLDADKSTPEATNQSS